MVAVHQHNRHMEATAMHTPDPLLMAIPSNHRTLHNSSLCRNLPHHTINHSPESSTADHQMRRRFLLANQGNHNAAALLPEVAEHIMRICLGHPVMA
jgi:hypothetical protein